MTKNSDWSTDDWGTPPKVVERLQESFAVTFDLDPCATDRQHCAPRYYTLADDGLTQPWNGHVFFNPPYSDVEPWVRRAAQLTSRHRCPFALGLLPPCVDTVWFHRWVLNVAELHFVKGRIKFLGADGKPGTSPRQPNIVAVFRDGPISRDHYSLDLT